MQETRARCTGENAEMNEVLRRLVALRQRHPRLGGNLALRWCSLKIAWAIGVGLLVMVALAACQSTPRATPTPTRGGVEGQVLMGPACPVVREGEPCPDQPYQALIVVLDAQGREVQRILCAPDGTFRINLPAGEYRLRVQNPDGSAYPMPLEVAVQVRADAFTPLTLTLDSGIR